MVKTANIKKIGTPMTIVITKMVLAVGTAVSPSAGKIQNLSQH